MLEEIIKTITALEFVRFCKYQSKKFKIFLWNVPVRESNIKFKYTDSEYFIQNTL